MSDINTMMKEYVNADPKPRTYGRYYASELYSIVTGKADPKTHFEQETIDLQGCRNICKGEAYEAMLKLLFDYNRAVYKYEPKEEIHLTDEITIVCKTDFLFEEFVMETKAPTAKTLERINREGIPAWYQMQLECTYRAFERPVKLGVFDDRKGFDLRTIEYQPSDERWNEITTKVQEFHNQVIQNN